MPDHEEASPVVADPRVSTGCGPLDVMLSGGLVPRRPYLVVGPSGTGKTTLALQFLCEGIRRGERCLVVTLEEPPNEIRANHRNLGPELDEVYVFDAIPDVMRYERAPFKDIAAVRQSIPFKEVPYEIRRSPELASVEVTFTALEQTLKMEMARRSYSRMVIDSLTALQYFCMKGFDETLGAQTFLRFLSDLHVTTLLTVESPLEDVESPERLLARGEIRLFRWELDSQTVRAIGVEKFRGSPHDDTLHPYRISPKGLDINLNVTISRDTRTLIPGGPEPTATAPPVEEFATGLAALEQDSRDLAELSADVSSVRAALLQAVVAAQTGDALGVARAVVRARGRVLEIAEQFPAEGGAAPESPALRRLRARASAARTGVPPFTVPDPLSVRPGIEAILRILETSAPAREAAPPVPPTPPAAAPAAPAPTAPLAAAVPPPASVPAAGEAPRPAEPSVIPPALSEPAAPSASVPPDAPRPHVPFPPPELRPPAPPVRPAAPAPPPPLPRGEPPPMPSIVPGPVLPGATAPAAPPPRTGSPAARTPSPGPVATAPPLPRPTSEVPVPPEGGPASATAGGPSPVIPPEAAPAGPEGTPAKKRRRAAPGATPRKRAPRIPKALPEAGPVAEPPAPSAPTVASEVPAAPDAAPAPAKKRRAPRKKPVAPAPEGVPPAPPDPGPPGPATPTPAPAPTEPPSEA